MKVIIAEVDNKGYITRFAKTITDFEKLYSELPEPTSHGVTYSFRPMVHIWYAVTDTEGSMFKTFFTDMTEGLSQTAVEEGNVASINYHEISPELIDCIKSISSVEITNLQYLQLLSKEQMLAHYYNKYLLDKGRIKKEEFDEVEQKIDTYIAKELNTIL